MKQRWCRTHVVLIAIVLALLAAGGSAGPAFGSTPEKSLAPLRIAVAAMISPEETITVYQELMDYIATKLGRPVEMKQRRTYQEVNDMLGTGKLDAAILCSGTYVHAHRQYRVELLAVPIIRGSPTYRSYIIVPAGSPLASFEELRDKRFAFTDPLSTSGYLYPVYYLVAHRLKLARFFAKTIFTYSHDNSIEAVAEAVVDGAAVDSLIHDYFQGTRPALIARTRIIHRSPPFGSHPVGVPRDLDPGSKRALRELFLKLHEDPAAQGVLRRLGVERFIPGEESLYDGIREMLRVVERARLR